MTIPLPDPASDPDLFDGLLARRTLAFLLDFTLILVLGTVLTLVLVVAGFLTFGLSWLGTPFILLIALVGYYAATLGSPRRATPGMMVFDIVLTPTSGLPLDGWRAFAHPLLFWLTSWFLTPFSLLAALFTPRRQMLHDLVLGTLMVRRSPMERHWSRYQAA